MPNVEFNVTYVIGTDIIFLKRRISYLNIFRTYIKIKQREIFVSLIGLEFSICLIRGMTFYKYT